MRKIFLTFIALTVAHIVFAQNTQTIVVRPETYREKQEREMRNVVEFFNDLGSLFGSTTEQRKAYLTEVKNSRYSTFVEEELAEWKKKGEFEKTSDWQIRLQDSTAIKKEEIQESAIDKFARKLRVVDDSYYLNDWLYDSRDSQYDPDEEVLNINTFWGKIPIPIPIDKARNMRMHISNLPARFFIYNDQLALLSLLYDKNMDYKYENQSPAATNFLQKEQENLQKELEIEAKRQSVVINGTQWATLNIGEKGQFVSQNPFGNHYTWEDAQTACPTGWRVPTYAEIQSLDDERKVSRKWITKNGVSGMKFTDVATGNILFLPAAGVRDDRDGVLSNSDTGYYWSSTATDSSMRSAYSLIVFNGGVNAYNNSRYGKLGFSVRCVSGQAQEQPQPNVRGR